MAHPEIRQKLETMLVLLKQERELTKAFRIEELQAVVAEKEALLENFKPQPEDVEGLEYLLKQVDDENRRNAYLLWSGLGVVRELMGFFHQSICSSVYNPMGQKQDIPQGGRLLSGKV